MGSLPDISIAPSGYYSTMRWPHVIYLVLALGAEPALDNYVQVYLAWGMLLCALGNPAAGEDLIVKFCNLHGADRQDPFLMRAL